MVYAPIIIPTLCRDKHFRHCIESLKRNTWACHTEVYVGIDYPLNDQHRPGWEAICRYCQEGDFSEFKAFHVIQRTENYGSYRNLNEIIQQVLQRYDRWIRTDDDCEFSPNFLEYMDRCLEEYEADDRVVGVTGYSFPLAWQVSKGATCFSQSFDASMWGTGFWARKHPTYYNYICTGAMLRDLPQVVRSGSYRRMIDLALTEYIPVAIQGRKYQGVLLRCFSDIALRAYLAIADRRIISPTVSKCRNLGFDGSGEFCHKVSYRIDQSVSAANYNYSEQPIDQSDNFSLVADSLHADEANRQLCSEFSRPLKGKSFEARCLVFGIRHLGLRCTKILYHIIRILRVSAHHQTFFLTPQGQMTASL